jgi:hypothetical protein
MLGWECESMEHRIRREVTVHANRSMEIGINPISSDSRGELRWVSGPAVSHVGNRDLGLTRSLFM